MTTFSKVIFMLTTRAATHFRRAFIFECLARLIFLIKRPFGAKYDSSFSIRRFVFHLPLSLLSPAQVFSASYSHYDNLHTTDARHHFKKAALASHSRFTLIGVLRRCTAAIDAKWRSLLGQLL